MVILGKWKNSSVTLSLKPICVTLSLETATSSRVFSFDLEGRLWTALVDEISYRRGLDGKIVAKWKKENGDRERRWLSEDEAGQITRLARQIINDFYADYSANQMNLSQEIPPQDFQSLIKAAYFNPQKEISDIQNYHRVYKPVGILPPDQYMSVVLQLTEGCSFNTCTFCNFYRDRPFRIKGPDEFKTHAIAVKDFLGQGLSLRRTIFLGDANALVTPTKKLISNLEVIHQIYDVEKLGGIYAFLDGFSGEKKTKQDYQDLAELGLKRIYIGMESGNPELLKFLQKPGSPNDVVEAVQNIKSGGIAVGIIILLGAGGKQYALNHIRDTVKVINQMPLDLDDIIYFSELIEGDELQYSQDAYRSDLQPLTALERIQQGEVIEDKLIFSPNRGTPHISRYDIREFVY